MVVFLEFVNVNKFVNMKSGQKKTNVCGSSQFLFKISRSNLPCSLAIKPQRSFIYILTYV